MREGYFSPDIQEFLRLLFAHRFRYLIVDGEAVIFHGHARLTGDVDLFFDQTEENSRALFASPAEFWKGEVPGIARAEELLEPGVIVQFGVPPNRIDLLSKIDGVSFDGAWAGRVIEQTTVRGGEVEIPYIGLADLIANKQAVNRPKDQEDLKYLKAAARPE